MKTNLEKIKDYLQLPKIGDITIQSNNYIDDQYNILTELISEHILMKEEIEYIFETFKQNEKEYIEELKTIYDQKEYIVNLIENTITELLLISIHLEEYETSENIHLFKNLNK